MNAIEILNNHQLKRTSCREEIINAILNAGQALSEDEIRVLQIGNYDRTTFYRSFKTLENNHILHKIVLNDVTVKYAVNDEVGNEHIHFHCNRCNTVTCLTATVPKYDLPEGYTSDSTKVMIEGVCPDCQKKQINNAEV